VGMGRCVGSGGGTGGIASLKEYRVSSGGKLFSCSVGWWAHVAVSTGTLPSSESQRHFYGWMPMIFFVTLMYLLICICRHFVAPKCQDRFSSTILLEGPGVQGTNEEVSPDTSRC